MELELKEGQYDGGDHGEWHIALWRITQAHDKVVLRRNCGTWWENGLVHMISETGEFANHAYREYNQIAVIGQKNGGW